MAVAKCCWRSRTVWLGVLEIAAGTLVLVVEADLVTRRPGAVLLVAAGVLTLLLRFLTDGPIAAPIVPRQPGGGTSGDQVE